jgi:hypothetical protein
MALTVLRATQRIGDAGLKRNADDGIRTQLQWNNAVAKMQVTVTDPSFTGVGGPPRVAIVLTSKRGVDLEIQGGWNLQKNGKLTSGKFYGAKTRNAFMKKALERVVKAHNVMLAVMTR